MYGLSSSLIMLVLLGYVIVYNLIIHRLQHRHGSVWSRLGKPTMFLRTPSSGWALVGFFFSQEHGQLGDAALSGYVWAARILLPLTTILMIVRFWPR